MFPGTMHHMFRIEVSPDTIPYRVVSSSGLPLFSNTRISGES